jgi:hypothetical protein
MLLDGPDLLTWLAKWAHGQRLELLGKATNLDFVGRVAELKPRLETIEGEMSFTHVLSLPNGVNQPLPECQFFVGEPPLVLVGNEFFVLRQGGGRQAGALGPRLLFVVIIANGNLRGL